MPNFTSGEWYFSQPRSGVLHIKASQFNCIATTSQAITPQEGITVLANARLMSAAPNLYEACKLALVKCPFPVGAVKAKEALEKAIAKAEGKL